MIRDSDEDPSVARRLQQLEAGRRGGDAVIDAPVQGEGIWDDAFLQLLRKAREMKAQSTHPDASSFDVEVWLCGWVKTPQPALGGRRPSELLVTPGGLKATLRLLGSIQSGSVQ